jgi:hypothetical protein
MANIALDIPELCLPHMVFREFQRAFPELFLPLEKHVFTSPEIPG